MTTDTQPVDASEHASFGAWINARRSAMNVTQDELADRINDLGGNITNGSVICHWETGRRRPNGMNLLALCRVLSVGIEEAQVRMAVKPVVAQAEPATT